MMKSRTAIKLWSLIPSTLVLATVAAFVIVPLNAAYRDQAAPLAAQCPTCHGSGQQLASCAVCGGDGVSSTGNKCQSCAGTGKRYVFCRTCGGDGKLVAINNGDQSRSARIVTIDPPQEKVMASCGLRCIENCGSTCTKTKHHKGFHHCGNGHTF